ncbi:OLC1v1003066C1 [Oldenlandia corymbosa var. corymbosa]|uniref:OLC1v1003066C1 n=1 Tax=Oldenlandia corymbosa var. corymbosa TaxID=529605 RepID=A0AAV1D968_OLDCO|nr:OLC1v1003066C1 [Oldenlandia corymbosa var. corymbosa]
MSKLKRASRLLNATVLKKQTDYADDAIVILFECAWALTNIVSGPSEYVEMVVKSDALRGLIRLLSSPSDDVRELAVLALGNIAGDSDSHRDTVLMEKALGPLLKLFNGPRLSMLRIATFTLFNLCRGKPRDVLPAFRVLSKLVFSDDKYVLPYACWALSFVFDGTKDLVNSFIVKGVCARLLELLDQPLLDVQIPALCIVRNVVRGNKQCMIDHGLLDRLRTLLVADNEVLQREACRTISDISLEIRLGEGSSLVLIDANLIEPLIYVLSAPGHSEGLRKVAGQAVLDVMETGLRVWRGL